MEVPTCELPDLIPRVKRAILLRTNARACARALRGRAPAKVKIGWFQVREVGREHFAVRIHHPYKPPPPPPTRFLPLVSTH
jgi:hypothetical protein